MNLSIVAFITEALLGRWTDSPSFLDLLKPFKIVLRDNAQKFEQRKQNYSTPQIKQANGTKLKFIRQVGYFMRLFFSFVQTRKTKKEGFGNYTKGNEIKIAVSLKEDLNTQFVSLKQDYEQQRW